MSRSPSARIRTARNTVGAALAVALALVTFAGTAAASHGEPTTPFDDPYHDACDPAYGGDPDRATCLPWEGLVEGYRTAHWLTTDGPGIVEALAQTLVENIEPTLWGVIEQATWGAGADQEWLEEDGAAWAESWTCFIGVASSDCGTDASVAQWAQEVVACQLDGNDCDVLAHPRIPPFLPPPPPYP